MVQISKQLLFQSPGHLISRVMKSFIFRGITGISQVLQRKLNTVFAMHTHLDLHSNQLKRYLKDYIRL